MAKNIKCALIPASSFGSLAVYIVRNQKSEDLKTISQGIIDTLFDVEGPNLKDAFEQGQDMLDYFRNIVKFVKIQGTNIIAPGFSDVNQFKFEESLVDTLQDTFKKQTEVPVNLEEEVVEVEPETPVAEEITNGEENPGAVYMSTILDEIAKKRKLEKGEIRFDKLVKTYFKGKEALAADFSTYFKRRFYSEWINTDAKANGKPAKKHIKDLNKVLLNLKDKLASNSLAVNEQLKTVTEEQLLSSEALIENYYDTIINNELASLVKEFYPGLDLSSDGNFLRAVRGEFTGRVGYATNEDALGGMDQTTDALNQHIVNTPRLVENEDGTFSVDQDKPFLTRADVANTASLLGQLSNDQDFEENFLNLIKITNDKDTRNILNSIYNNFFNPEVYKIGSQNKISLSKIGALKNAVNDTKRFMTSLTNKSFVGVRNGQVVYSKDNSQALRKQLTNDYESTITDAKSKKALSTIIANKISIDSGAAVGEGEIQLNINVGSRIHNIVLKAANNYKNGVPVQVVNSSITTDIDKIAILKALKLPSSFANRKFLTYYNDNIASFASNNDIGVENLIGNLAFVVALNDKGLRQSFSDNEFNPIPSSEQNEEAGRLLYSPFNILHAFLNPIVAYDEKLSGSSEAKNVQNVNGDFVTTVGIRSTMDNFNARLNQERELGNASVHSNNLLINSSSGYSLSEFVSKDGIIERDNRKGNQSFTKKEHFKTAVVDYYLKTLDKSNFKEAAFQLGTMSDRKDPKMGLFSGDFGNVKDLQVITKGPTKGMTRGFEKIYNYESRYHKNLTEIITNTWKEQLDNWLVSGDIIIEEGSELEFLYKMITDINSLQDFLLAAKIPTTLAMQSTILEQQLMYKPEKESKIAVVKGLIIQMNKIWSNPSLANDFLKSEYNNFLTEVLDSEEGLSLNDMTFADKAIMVNHFQQGMGRQEGLAFRNMLKLYFQDHMLMSRNALNLTGGHIYEYKGDLSENKAKENILRDKLKKGGKTEEQIEKEIKDSRVANALEKATIDQSKRLAMITSGFQKPKTINSEVAGTELGASSKVVLVSDPKALVQLLGDLRHDTDQEIYDAAMLAHPLYRLRLNSSFGEENSGFASLGGAIKDITLDYNPRTGSVRGQKKATFSVFINEILKKSPALQRLFRKMNESITFAEPLNGAINMHQLWVQHGSYNNDSAWEEILELISTTQDSNGRYSYRDAYIEKVGFASGEKMGSRGFNSDNIWKDTTTPLIYTEVSNKNHGVILNADHDVDTSGDTSSKSLMTQLISAVNFGGYSLTEANDINDALNSVSKIGIYKIKKEIKSIARKQILDGYTKSELTLTNNEYDKLKQLLLTNHLTEDQELEFDNFLSQTGILTKDFSGSAAVEYARSIAEKAISSRDSMQLADIVSPEVSALNSPQLSNVVHSAIQAVINTETNKFKFKGQEMVVAPGAGFIKLYTLPGTDKRVTREEYIHHMGLKLVKISKEELNLIPDSETVELNGKEMLAIEAKLAANKNSEIKAIILKEEDSDELKWMNYISKKTGESINKSPEYISLLENSEQLKEAKKEGNKELYAELEAKRELLQIDLENILVEGDWETKAAEIAMPSMHMASFDLYQDEEANMGKGEEGAEALLNSETGSYISLTDIMGAEQTGGIYYLLNGEIVNEGVEGAIKIYDSEIQSMGRFFANRILNNPKKYKLGQFKQFDSLTLGEAKNRMAGLTNRLNSVEGFEVDNINYRIQGFNDVISKYNVEGISDDVELTSEDLNIINTALKSSESNYILRLAEMKAFSFPSSLEAFMARVPGQSKQSGAPARIKTFVFSTRNSIYAPVELLTVTGADHDIDKAHVLVYSIDDKGNFYSYKEYLDKNGKINYADFDKLLAAKIAKKAQQLQEAGITGKDAQEKLDSFTKKEILKFQEGTKNFILNKMMKVYGDPKNAIEASTPMSMENLKAAIEDEWIVDITEEGDTVVNKGRISPYSPASIFALERVNAIGKDGIGIFATGLKTYAAVYNSFRNNAEGNANYVSEKVDFYTSEEGRLGLDKNGKADREVQETILEYISEDFEGDFNALAVYDGEGNPVISREVSGISRWTKGIRKFKDAWRDLSELLSAATDNAKELILAKIGADSATSGVIGSAIISGIPMEPVLDLFKTKEVKALVRKFEKENDLVANPNGAYRPFSTIIEEDWASRVNGILSEIRSNKNRVENLRKQSNKQIITSETIKANLNGSINNVTISTDLPLGIDSGLDVTVENAINGAAYFDKAKELGLDLTRITDKEVIAMMRAMEGASTIILKDNQDTKSLIAIKYAEANNIEIITTRTGALPLISLKAGKLAVIGALSTPSKNKLANENIADIIANNKEAIENSAEYDKNAELEFTNKQLNLIQAEEKLKASVKAYLSDGARQLLTFSKLGDENRAISSFLSINGGTPNGRFDVYNYYNKIAKAASTPDLSYTAGDMKLFLKALVNGESETVESFISNYEAVKTGINPFFVMANSPSYIGQVEGMIFGSQLDSNATFSGKAVENYITSFHSSNPRDKKAYAEINSVIYGLTIDSYLKSKKKTAKLGGVTYDLSTKEGREDFIKAVPDFKDELINDPKLEDNAFIQRLRLDFAKDGLNDIAYLRSDDLNTLSPDVRSVRQLNLTKLKNMGGKYEDIYNALYLYSLITKKGTRGADDFASLFEYDETLAYREYLDHLKEIEKDPTFFDSLNNLSTQTKELLAPQSVAVISTKPGKISFEGDTESEGDFDSDVDLTQKKNGYKNDGLQVMPSIPKKGPKYLTFRSAETGQLYALRKGEYLPVSLVSPMRSIPYSLLDTEIKSDPLAGSGFKFGYEAIINDDGTKAQVLKFKDKKYVVELENGNTTTVTKEDLQRLNPDMLFSNANFGPLSDSDRVKMAQKKDLTAKSYTYSINNSLADKDIEKLKKGPLFTAVFITDQNSSDFYAVGEIVKKEIIKGTPAKLIYRGKHGRDNTEVISNMAYGNKAASALENKKVNEIHVFEYELERELTDTYPDIVNSAGASSASMVRVEKNQTNHFVSSKFSSKLKVGSTGIYSRKGKLYKVTNKGFVKDLYAPGNKKALGEKLAITRGVAYNNIDNYFKADSADKLYEVLPYNAKENSRNSYLEYNLMKDEEFEANLKGNKVTLRETGANPSASSLLNEMGVEDVAYFSNVDETYFSEILPVINEEAGKIGVAKVDESSKVNISALNDSEVSSIFMVSSFENSVSRLNADVKIKDKGSSQLITDILKFVPADILDGDSIELIRMSVKDGFKDKTVKDSLKDVLLDLEQDLNDKMPNELNKRLLDSGYQATKLKNEILKLKETLSQEIELNKELRYVTKGVNFGVMQAAKRSGKDFFIFNPINRSWFKYDTNTGNFEPTRIPLLSGKDLFIGEGLSNKNKTAIDSVLKASSKFKSLQDKPATIPFKSTDIIVSGVEVNQSINEVTETGLEAIKDFVVKAEDFTSEVSIQGVRIPATKEGFTAVDFNPLDSDQTTIKKHKDGTISIITKLKGVDTVLAVFPDEKLRKSYADFTGYKVFKNFKINVDGELIAIPEAHVTTLDYFERRDLSIKEKKNIKSLETKLEEQFRNEIYPLYSSLRYKDAETAGKFRDVDSYQSFIFFGKEGYLDFTEEEQTLFDELLVLDEKYKKDSEELNNKINTVTKAGEFNAVDVKVGDGVQGDVKVIISDINLVNNITPDAKRETLTSRGQKTNEGVFALPLIEDRIDGFRYNLSKIEGSFRTILKEAALNPTKTYTLDLYGAASDSYIGAVTNEQVWKSISHVLHRIKPATWPSNFIVNGEGGNFINQEKGGFFRKSINRTVPYFTSGDITDYDTVDVSYFSKNYKFKNGDTVEERYRSSSDVTLKDIWYNWATENRADFEELARKIGTKGLYDYNLVLEARSKYFGSKPGDADRISTAKILVDLLNDNFISTNWVYYQRHTYQPEAKFQGLLEGQYRIPVSAKYRDKLNLDFNGKIILNIDGKDFIATEIDYSEGAVGFNENNLLSPMGIDSEMNASKFILDNYGIAPKDKYYILSLTPFSGKRPTANKVERGTFGKILEEAVAMNKIDVDSEFIELANQATGSVVLDLSSRLVSENSDSPVYSNQRLEDIKNVLGGKLALDFDSSDAVHISGNTLEDNIAESTLVNAFKTQVEPLLKHYTLLDVDILVGNNTGLDELVRLYLSNNSLTPYIETSKGLFQPASKVTEGKTFKNEERVKVYAEKNKNRFETFSLERIGNNPHSISFNAEAKQGLYSYEIDLEEGEIASWNGNADNKLVSDLIKDFNLLENENSSFSNTLRSDLIIEEQRYISRYIGAVALIKTKTQAKLNTIEEFDSYISDLRSTNEEFNEKYLELSDKIFDSSFRFKNISDIAALAMARSRNITNTYLTEIFAEEAISVENNPYGALLNAKRKEYENSREYKNMLDDTTLTKSTLNLITNSKGATLKDVYNLFLTLGENKSYRNGKLSGELLNKKLVNNGISAIKSEGKISLLDQNLLISLNQKKAGVTVFEDVFESTRKQEVSIGYLLENKFTAINPKFMKLLKKSNILSIDYLTGVVTANIGEETFKYEIDAEKANVKAYETIFNAIKQNMIVDMFNNIGIEFDVNDVKENTRNSMKFMGLASLYNMPIEKALFIGQAEEILPEEIFSVEVGKTYNVEEDGIITNTLYAFKKKGLTNFIDKAGSIYTVKDNKLVKSDESADFSGIREELNFATPKLAEGGEANALRLVDNSIVTGYIAVSEADGVVKAVNKVDGEEYVWVSESRAWATTKESSDAELNLDLSAETEVKPGQKIMSIRLNGNLVVDLSNGIAISKDVIEDNKRRFTRDSQTGLWNLEAPDAIRGFKNTDIRYQKAKVTYTDNANKKLASKSVSPALLGKLVQKLSSTLNLPVNTVSNLDIEFDDRFTGNKDMMNSAGFVYDGETFININKATLDTPMHELLGHVFLGNLKSTNKNLFNKIIKESLNETEAVAEVLAEYPEYQNSPEDLGEEVFSSIIGVKLQGMAESYLNKEESSLNFWEKIAKIMRDFFTNNLGPIFGYTNQIKPTDSLDTIINKLGEDVFKNEGTIFKELTTAKGTDLMTILNPTLTQEEVQDKFKSYGWIKEICR